MNIVSPMCTGNGAFVSHSLIQAGIKNYKVIPYHPIWTLVPPALFWIGRSKYADLIHTTPDFAYFAIRRNVPMVVTFRNYVLDPFMEQHSSFLQRIHYATDLRWFTKLAVKHATVITAVSHFIADLAKSDLISEKKFRVIYNGIDASTFTPKKAPQTSKEIKVIFSGNLTRRKGALLIPKIAKLLNPNIKIYYTSGLRENRRFPDQDNLRCLGNVSHKDMPELYNMADILLFPTYREGFGLAVAEAMACGLPIVATNGSSMPELVDHGKGGFLCPVGDASSFAEKINFLADSNTTRQEMGEYNRAKVEENFTVQRMVRDYHNLFQEILG